jgi:hypothetical protein
MQVHISYFRNIYKSFLLKAPYLIYLSRGSLVAMATWWMTGVRFPEGARDVSSIHSVQTGPKGDEVT